VAGLILIFVVGIYLHADVGDRYEDVVVLAICGHRVRISRVELRNGIGGRVDSEDWRTAEVNAVVPRVVPDLVATYSSDRFQSSTCLGIEDHTAARHETLAGQQDQTSRTGEVHIGDREDSRNALGLGIDLVNFSILIRHRRRYRDVEPVSLRIPDGLLDAAGGLRIGKAPQHGVSFRGDKTHKGNRVPIVCNQDDFVRGIQLVSAEAGCDKLSQSR